MDEDKIGRVSNETINRNDKGWSQINDPGRFTVVRYSCNNCGAQFDYCDDVKMHIKEKHFLKESPISTTQPSLVKLPNEKDDKIIDSVGKSFERIMEKDELVGYKQRV